MTRRREIYRAEQLPVFQNRMFESADAAKDCTRGDVILVQDQTTGLVFNSVFNPALMEYGPDYQNEQAVSGAFQQHLVVVSDVIRRHFMHQSLIEVGCGKGYFLEYLQSLNFDVTGFDPAYEGSNPAIVKSSFVPGTSFHADGVVLRHVLEHVRDPLALLSDIRDANGGRGRIYIEVPCLDWISVHRAWFDIFYEHVNYFRVGDFQRMFGGVHEAGKSFGGQYLYVVADLASLRVPKRWDDFSLPSDFLDTVNQYAALLNGCRRNGAAAIWGGASKGVTFALFMERAGANVDTVIDMNAAKQGKYLPATGLQVVSPAEALPRLPAGSDLFVMNSNYLTEIKEMTRHAFEYRLVGE